MAQKKGAFSAIIVLCSVCLLASLVLTISATVTKDRIAENEQKLLDALQKEMLPKAEGFEKVENFSPEEGVLSVYKATNDAGWVITSTAPGDKGRITAVTGIDSNGKITKVRVTDAEGEMPGTAAKLNQNSYINQYVGASSISSSRGHANTAYIENLSGVKCSDAVFSAVSTALLQCSELREETGAVKDER